MKEIVIDGKAYHLVPVETAKQEELLTDEEVASVRIENYDACGDWIDFARAIESAVLEKLKQQEPVAFKRFISDVHTAAGLVRHGKRDAGLSDRLSEMVMHYITRPAPMLADDPEKAMLFKQANVLHQVASALGYAPGDDITRAPQSVAELVSQRDELLTAAEDVEADAEECMDFDDCTGMFIPIDSYHKLMEAIARVKEKK